MARASGGVRTERPSARARAGKALEKEKKSRPPRPKNNEKSIAKLEKEIAKLEAQSAELDRQAEEFSSDYQKLMDIQQQKDALDEELLALYERWEELNA